MIESTEQCHTTNMFLQKKHNIYGGVASIYLREKTVKKTCHKPSAQTHCFRLFDAAQQIYPIVSIVGLKGAS